MLYSRLIYATITGLFYIGLGVLSLIRDPRARLNRAFALFLFSLAVWSMAGYALLLLDPQWGVPVYRLLYLAGPLALWYFVVFIQILVQVDDTPSGRFWRRVSGIFCLVSVPLHLTPLVIRNFTYIRGQDIPFTISSGPFYPLIQAAMGITVIAGAIVTYCHMQRATGTERNQLKYVFLACVIGSSTSVLIILRSLSIWAPVWTYFITQMLSTFCLAYIIFKYELFEFEVWMRRAAIFVGVYTVILGLPFALFPLYGQHLLSWRDSPIGIPAAFISYGILCSLSPGITSFLRDKTEERMKRDLISNITHEFKGPLNNMENALEILSKEMGKQSMDKNEVQEFLTMAEKNAARLGHFIQNLLEMARIERPDVSLHPEDCRIDELVSEAVKTAEPEARKKGISIITDIPAPITLHADVEKLRQVFSNLISNAVKYTEKGTVSVATCINGQKLKISVKDTGTGIDPAYLSRVFDRFFRTPESKQMPVRGTGLGLSIVKGWVEAHGGKVWAESKGRGQGSLFVVELPL